MKLEINSRRKTGNFTYVWKLNITVLNNQCFKEEFKWEMTKYFETNENRSTTYQNLRDAAKVVVREKVIAITTYIKKESPISNLNSKL